jgi:hypothetical protein
MWVQVRTDMSHDVWGLGVGVGVFYVSDCECTLDCARVCNQDGDISLYSKTVTMLRDGNSAPIERCR